MICLTAALLQGQEGQPVLEFGFQERIRSEAWDNLVDHRQTTEDIRSQLRFRTRLWTVVPLSPSLTFAAGLVNENRKVTRPDQAVNGREVVFETLYLDWRMAPDWSVRVGRQTLVRGDGFILCDGSALDGSRTAYVNALDLAWSRGEGRLEFLAISDPHTDQYLPRLNEAANPTERVLLNERDEAALGLYGTWRQGDQDLQGYLFHKTERHDSRALGDPRFTPDRRVDTLGARWSGRLRRGLTLVGEGAVQGGRQEGRPGTAEPAVSIRAWGGQARLTQRFATAFDPQLTLGWVELSGDDPATPAKEGWDPLFSRWPQWSEAYVSSQIPEAGVATWTNLRLWEVTLQLKPHARVGLRTSVMWLRAHQPATVLGPLFANGLGRGRVLELRGDLKLTERWQGHILYERLDPGTFYAGPDAGRYFRMEVIYTLRQRP